MELPTKVNITTLQRRNEEGRQNVSTSTSTRVGMQTLGYREVQGALPFHPLFSYLNIATVDREPMRKKKQTSWIPSNITF
jgi:hypothetical protein